MSPSFPRPSILTLPTSQAPVGIAIAYLSVKSAVITYNSDSKDTQDQRSTGHRKNLFGVATMPESKELASLSLRFALIPGEVTCTIGSLGSALLILLFVSGQCG